MEDFKHDENAEVYRGLNWPTKQLLGVPRTEAIDPMAKLRLTSLGERHSVVIFDQCMQPAVPWTYIHMQSPADQKNNTNPSEGRVYRLDRHVKSYGRNLSY